MYVVSNFHSLDVAALRNNVLFGPQRQEWASIAFVKSSALTGSTPFSELLHPSRTGLLHTAKQSQKAVSVHFKSEQILRFVYVEQYCGPTGHKVMRYSSKHTTFDAVPTLYKCYTNVLCVYWDDRQILRTQINNIICVWFGKRTTYVCYCAQWLTGPQSS